MATNDLTIDLADFQDNRPVVEITIKLPSNATGYSAAAEGSLPNRFIIPQTIKRHTVDGRLTVPLLDFC